MSFIMDAKWEKRSNTELQYRTFQPKYVEGSSVEIRGVFLFKKSKTPCGSACKTSLVSICLVSICFAMTAKGVGNLGSANNEVLDETQNNYCVGGQGSLCSCNIRAPLTTGSHIINQFLYKKVLKVTSATKNILSRQRWFTHASYSL